MWLHLPFFLHRYKKMNCDGTVCDFDFFPFSLGIAVFTQYVSTTAIINIGGGVGWYGVVRRRRDENTSGLVARNETVLDTDRDVVHCLRSGDYTVRGKDGRIFYLQLVACN